MLHGNPHRMKYHLARGETQLGIFTDLEVSAGLRDGRFQAGDLCWMEGMKEWQSLDARMKEIANEAGLPPPLPVISDKEEPLTEAPMTEPVSVTRRLAAKIIDWSLLLVPFMGMLSLLMDPAFEAQVVKLQNDPPALMAALQKQIEKAVTEGNPLFVSLGWLMDIVILTQVILLTIRGQSIGKWMLGLRIVCFQGGGRAGFLKAVLLRSFLFFTASLLGPVGLSVLLVDALMIFRKDRRCLHDLVAGTVVIRSFKLG